MAARLFTDEFDRPDGPLGAQWVDGHDAFPEFFEPLGIASGKVVITDPKTRGGTPYAAWPVTVHPPENSLKYHGIGCAWRETESRAVRVLTRWCGSHGITDGTPHVEGTPLIHVTPGTERFGFGVWPSLVYGVPFLLAGYIGGPPELFADYVVATAQFTHNDGDEHDIEVRSDGTNATVYLDGSLVTTWSTYGTNLPLSDDVRFSTLHGFAVDAHQTEVDEVPDNPAITRIEIEGSDELGWVSNEGDTVVGSLTVDPGTTGTVRIVNDGTGAPALHLYAADAHTYPVIAFASFLGSPLLGFGSGSATGDAFLARSAPGVVASSLNGVGQFHGGTMQTVNAQTGTSYTTVLADKAYIITRNNGSASTHDWPSNATAAIPVGTVIQVINIGAGTVTHQAGSGASLAANSNTSQTAGQIRWATKTGTNTWSIN